MPLCLCSTNALPGESVPLYTLHSNSQSSLYLSTGTKAKKPRAIIRDGNTAVPCTLLLQFYWCQVVERDSCPERVIEWPRVSTNGRRSASACRPGRTVQYSTVRSPDSRIYTLASNKNSDKCKSKSEAKAKVMDAVHKFATGTQ